MMSADSGALADRFRTFATREAEDQSPLYAALSRKIADTPDLLALADLARPGQPRPNMLFAAVHKLLLEGRDDPLAGFYASLTETPQPANEAFPLFLSFCQTNAEEVRALLASRAVGTNEVRRAACLLPAFATIARESPEPLQLIEIGASAGLNLFWDRYDHDYGIGGTIGREPPALRLHCDLRGGFGAFRLPSRIPRIGVRIGIDPDPMDLGNPDDLAWLRALIWPEQRDRAERLLTAAQLVGADRPDMRAGLGNDLLRDAFGALPESGTACIFHSFTLNQFSADAKARFEALLGALGESRPLYRIGLEWGNAEAPELRLWYHHQGQVSERLLAHCDAHGAWIVWAEA